MKTLLTRPAVVDADAATSLALLNCLVREVCAPESQAWPEEPYLIVRLPRADVMLRARLHRPPVGPTYRLGSPVEELRGPGTWRPVDWRRLTDLVAGELELATGTVNPELAEQVAASHAATAAIVARRAAAQPPDDPYLESEQGLVAGHRFHPSPKARQGAPEDWLGYAPETYARFPLHWLAVRDNLVAEDGDAAALAEMERLGPPAPRGYRTLPAHPWQLGLLQTRPALRSALASGSVIDLGPGGPTAAPTSSVRTAYLPDADMFLKFSLDVRITNCVRKNAWYELTGAVALTRLLRPVFAELGALFGGCTLLGEPAYRSVALADLRCHEGLGVIVRDGVRGCNGTPLLAAAIADQYGTSRAAVVNLLYDATPEHALAWWDAYVGRVVPPVLHAYLAHGVVLEPHVQNVLMAVDADGMPTQAIFRDLEGTKLLPERWGDVLATMPDQMRAAMTYEAERGWDRVVYCLFVNHLAEVAAAIADLQPTMERELWRLTRVHLVRYEKSYGSSPRLRTLLAGVPWPAKANLRTRWARSADRQATYVPTPNPLADLEVVNVSGAVETLTTSRSAQVGP